MSMQRVEPVREVLSLFGLQSRLAPRSSELMAQMLESRTVRWFAVAVVAMSFVGLSAKTISARSLPAAASVESKVDTEPVAFQSGPYIRSQFQQGYLALR